MLDRILFFPVTPFTADDAVFTWEYAADPATAAYTTGSYANIKVEKIDSHQGQVKLAGEIWTARSYDPSVEVEVGAPVDVLEIKGATALVYPTEEPWTTSG